MRARSEESRALPAVRVVATPVPARRLYGACVSQMRALFDDVLSEPLPPHLVAALTTEPSVASPSKPAAPSRD